MSEGRASTDTSESSKAGIAAGVHVPVMTDEVTAYLSSGNPDLLVDGTAGGGGHLDALLRATGTTSFMAFDRDPDAVAGLRARFADEPRVRIEHGSYTTIPVVLEESGTGQASGALFDLGLSSVQLDDPSRGFSYGSGDGPLDMRFDRGSSCPSAGEVLNRYSEKDIADIIYRFGEEHRSRAIARAIVRARPLSTTAELVLAVKSTVRGRANRVLSRVFQALRIYCNDELGQLRELLDGIQAWVVREGRVAFITFHSLEDRMVKQFFRDSAEFTPTSPPWAVPTDGEKRSNPRSRSARLRTGVRS
jgi:16S rRNA (cytosine1402-N4)-methyltransferase